MGRGGRKGSGGMGVLCLGGEMGAGRESRKRLPVDHYRLRMIIIR